MQRSCSRWILAAAVALICLSMGQLFSPSLGRADDDRVAERNPSTVDLGGAEVPKTAAAARQTAAATEWTYHKTSDNLHPDGNEQQFLWLLNRARSNPVQEGIWLATMGNPEVAASRDYFNVDEAVLQREFAGYAAQPPAAFDARLYGAAKAHSDYLISIDGQNHNNQIDRISSAGFRYSQAAAIVFSYSQNTIHGYAGFNIDQGAGTDGTQDPPGHRYAIMSIGGNYANVGVAVVPETNPATRVGPQVVSGNLCYANTGFPDHSNRFIVGTVWEDTNANDQYDPGEGLDGVTVMPDKGAYYAVTGESGGYASPILSDDVQQAGFWWTKFYKSDFELRVLVALSEKEYAVRIYKKEPANGVEKAHDVIVEGENTVWRLKNPQYYPKIIKAVEKMLRTVWKNGGRFFAADMLYVPSEKDYVVLELNSGPWLTKGAAEWLAHRFAEYQWHKFTEKG